MFKKSNWWLWFWHQFWCFLYHQANLSTPAECPITQLSSDTVYLEIVPNCRGWGCSPIRLQPLPRFRGYSQVQVVTCASDPSEVFTTLLWVQLIWWSGLQNLEKHFTYWIPGLLQKDVTQEQSDGRDTLFTICFSSSFSMCLPT